ncbi:HesA/MoeB/ThiF family protein [Microbacterium sp. ZXX196]|uniref:HesA/MoeB/ThiF family protein n=1 Tax=Microbacterium sp. ZXX196 TaxID=2609291 RepID=UPI0012B8BC6D|nr:HesA/MoeB/ThiF family protein [Microbacterium sp. ZXX196]MTE23663.1 hypothetical protein [Microbacterium sp. ZXX196]
MPLPPRVAPVSSLSAEEERRTARHLALAGLGAVGQRRFAAAHVAVVGAGGLGSPVVQALAAGGVGRLTVIDDDDVELTNLQRQGLHRLTDIGRPKVDSAVRVAADIAPECRVDAVRERLDADNAARLLAGADIVVDGTDTMATRQVVGDWCAASGVPLVWGVVQETAGQVTVFWSDPPAGHAPTRLTDLFPGEPAGGVPTCAEVGVLTPVVHQVGAIMATQVLLLVAGIGEPLLGRVAVVDALRSTTREVPLAPATRSDRPLPERTGEADPLAGAGLVIDVREPEEHRTGVIPGALLLPLGQLLADPAAVARAADGREVAVVCQAGPRAERAAAALSRVGVRARSVAGGMAGWTGAIERPGGRA